MKIFNNKILLIGFGGVGQTMLPLILKHVAADTKNITVIEKDDHTALFNEKYGSTGVSYIVKEVTRLNLTDILDEYVGENGLIINLSLGINVYEIVQWCLDNNTMYTDTSLETWPNEHSEATHLSEKTLYMMHHKIRGMTDGKNKAPTILVTNGANPGLVNQFVKAALIDISKTLGTYTTAPTTQNEWAKLCMNSGIKVIHIAEKDDQEINLPKKKGEFVNTWSIDGFWDEGNGPVEIGWGTHESEYPEQVNLHTVGTKSAVYLNSSGVDTLSKSWLPIGKEYKGYMVQHSESITLCEYFTVKENSELKYRPTVYYVYHPNEYTIQSVDEFRGETLDAIPKRIVKTEVTSGHNELGVLLLGDKISWWYGSQLSIETSNKLIPGENPTTLQVAANMIAGVIWMLNNPREGYVEPEDLPFDQIIDFCKPYVYPIVSVKTDWRPGPDLQLRTFMVEP